MDKKKALGQMYAKNSTGADGCQLFVEAAQHHFILQLLSWTIQHFIGKISCGNKK